MSKSKEIYFFLITENNKIIKLLKLVNTFKGDNYYIPFPNIQRELGGLDIHSSIHLNEIKHLKSRKLSFYKTNAGIEDFFLKFDKSQLPLDLAMKLFNINEFINLAIKSDGKNYYIDMKDFKNLINFKVPIIISKIKRLPSTIIGFFEFNDHLNFFIEDKIYSIYYVS